MPTTVMARVRGEGRGPEHQLRLVWVRLGSLLRSHFMAPWQLEHLAMQHLHAWQHPADA